MSWFRSSRRRHSEAPPAAPEGPAGEAPAAEQDANGAAAAPPAVPAEELQGKPLADLHLLAAEHGIPRFRMLRREQLVAALGGGEVEAPAPAPPPPPAARPPRPPRQERRPRRREPPEADEVSLEDLERPVERSQSSFEELPVQRPSRSLDLGSALGARMVQILAPAGRGQRAMIAGPAGTGATTLLREFGTGLAGAGLSVQAVLVDVRPEEVPEWEGRVAVAAADASRSPREQVALAERALEDAKQAAAGGADAVVLLDSLSRLARAYGLTSGSQADALEAAKRWFSSARDGGPGRGSLTLIATARVETESPLDALVYDALEDSANMVVRLSPALAARGKYPAIDPARTRTLGEEALLDPEHRRALENMRGVARSLDPEEAWEFLAERARERS